MFNDTLSTAWGSGVVHWTMGWTVWGLIPRRDRRFSFSRKRPGRLCGPPSLLFSGNQEFFPWGVKWLGREVDHTCLWMPRLGKCGAVVYFPGWVLLDCAHYTEPQTRSCAVSGSENIARLVGLLLWSLVLRSKWGVETCNQFIDWQQNAASKVPCFACCFLQVATVATSV